MKICRRRRRRGSGCDGQAPGGCEDPGHNTNRQDRQTPPFLTFLQALMDEAAVLSVLPPSAASTHSEPSNIADDWKLLRRHMKGGVSHGGFSSNARQFGFTSQRRRFSTTFHMFMRRPASSSTALSDVSANIRPPALRH